MAVVSFKDEFVVEPLPNLENDTEAIWAKALLPGEEAVRGQFLSTTKVRK